MAPVASLDIPSLVEDLHTHPVNSNPFFQAFKDRYLSPRQMRVFVKQYHYFCFHFVKVLEGLLYRTPVEELDMRVELTKTLYSELGNGISSQAHIRQLQTFARSIGLRIYDLQEVEPLPEVMDYLDALHKLFIDSDYLTALGAELAVETTAASEFQYFYPGLQKYEHFTREDLEFFELHLLEEVQHSNWLILAVQKTAKTSDDLDQVSLGAMATADAWLAFWDGMYRCVFETTPPQLSR